jgi:hypothetical protein
MSQKAPRPAKAPMGRAGRAAGLEFLGGGSGPENNKATAQPKGEPPKDPPVFTFKTQFVEATGCGAERLASTLREAVERAFALDGMRAFECTKRAAAFHEAGHCVIQALDRNPPMRVGIWPIRKFGMSHWIGRADGTSRWRVDHKTTVEADLKQARSQLAGVVAEALFDADYRLASSIDEIVISQVIVRSAATKTHRHAERLWWKTLLDVMCRLKAHERPVLQIADELMHKGNIKARQLAHLLQTVVGAVDA